MEQIRRFIECLVPASACNMHCSYCYVIQRGEREPNWKSPFLYRPEIVGRALSLERMGGVCYFSICGAGETLMMTEVVDIVTVLLRNGHFVNVTTNGTLTKRFKQLLALPSENLERLHFSFSFHYLELLPDKLNIFFDNICKVRSAGCSFLVQLNLVDDYLPHLDEIKRLCLERLGALPQIVATRKETDLHTDIRFYTKLEQSEYQTVGISFDSPLFDFTMNNFGVRRNEFCYAGDWSATLDLATGIMTKCYASFRRQNIFEDTMKPISFGAIGAHCQSLYCLNGSHFLALGVMPDAETPTYASLRNRGVADWYSERMQHFLGQKLHQNNTHYGHRERFLTHVEFVLDQMYSLKPKIGRLLRKAGVLSTMRTRPQKMKRTT
jgi:hypothetical protein